MDLSGPRLGRTLKLLHRKLWQNAVLYDEHDRCASVYQPADRADDRADRTQKLACLVTIFQQPITPPSSFHCQALTEGTLAPGCLYDGLLTGLVSSQCWWETPFAFVCVRYSYELIFTHRMCWRWREWLQARWWMRSLQGRHTVSALMFGCISIPKKAQWTVSLASSLKDLSIHI